MRVASELHESGDPHLHALVCFHATKNFKSSNCFDIDTFHANVQVCKNVKSWFTYVSKDNNYLDEGTLPNNLKNTPGENIFQQMLAANNHEELLVTCINKRVSPFYYKMASKKFKKRENTIESNEWSGLVRFTIDLPITFDKTWVLYGTAGTGKTSWAIKNMPMPALIISHLDKLKNFDPDFHKSIIFDDVSVAHLPITSQIHIADQDLERDIHIRYGTACIPAHTPKIFTCNEFPFSRDNEALQRRLQIIKT